MHNYKKRKTKNIKEVKIKLSKCNWHQNSLNRKQLLTMAMVSFYKEGTASLDLYASKMLHSKIKYKQAL